MGGGRDVARLGRGAGALTVRQSRSAPARHHGLGRSIFPMARHSKIDSKYEGSHRPDQGNLADAENGDDQEARLKLEKSRYESEDEHRGHQHRGVPQDDGKTQYPRPPVENGNLGPEVVRRSGRAEQLLVRRLARSIIRPNGWSGLGAAGRRPNQVDGEMES